MVGDSSAYWCDMFIHIDTFKNKITPRYISDPVGGNKR